MARVITYECTQCGTEVIVTESLETGLSPIYCCGFEVTEIASPDKKSPKPKKKTVKKTVKKTMKKSTKKGAKKKVIQKKKPAVK
ncbi:MAG TPA: hypothetical protein DCP92_07585 [Nitrospiraceae bacterium]|nr:hypothetical protein [Nitrospiraceae bacterium]